MEDTKNHYKIIDWPARKSYVTGEKNVRNVPLVESRKIILPSLHIKLGLMKNFVKVLIKESEGFKRLRVMFPKLNEVKLKEGIFIGPEIRKLLKDLTFDAKRGNLKLASWLSFKAIVRGFLGNRKDDNYTAEINDLLENYKNKGRVECH